MLEAPKDTLRFNVSLGELAGLYTVVLLAEIYDNEWLTSVTSKGKRHMEWSVGEAKLRLARLLSQQSHTGHTNSPATSWDYVSRVANQGNSLENQCSGYLLGVNHIGSFQLACNKITDFLKESNGSAQAILFAQDSGDMVSRAYQWMGVETLLKCRFPDASQGQPCKRAFQDNKSGLLL